MPFGIALASEKYQRCTHESLEVLNGVEDVTDHILCVGKGDTSEEDIIDQDRNLIAFLKRCHEKNIKLNANKMKLRLSEFCYTGHLLTAEGLKPDQTKVKAISEMLEPTNVRSSRRFWAW